MHHRSTKFTPIYVSDLLAVCVTRVGTACSRCQSCHWLRQ